MKIEIVAILDRAADAFSRPIFVNAIGQAIRSFQDEINRVDPQNEMQRHPDDFDLYHLASWDDNTGKFVNQDEPKQIAIGKQMVREYNTP